MTFRRRIAHLIPYVGAAQGGPVRSLVTLTGELESAGFHNTVFGARLEGDGPVIAFDPRIDVRTSSATRMGGYRRSKGLWSEVGRSIGAFDIIHSHSLWTDANRLAAVAGERAGVPHLVSPCGTLNRITFGHRRWKKLPVWWFFQQRALQGAACLHAKSDREAEDIRSLGLDVPVAVIPNPVPSPPPATDVDAESERAKYRIGPSTRYVLFLGRIHPLKRIDWLIEAWSATAADPEEWVLVLAGPEEESIGRQLRELARSRGCEDGIRMPGMVDGDAKWALLRNAAYLVLPSDWENFGVVVAEALRCGVPPITTRGNPWRVLSEEGCGWWVDPGAAPLAEALNEALALGQTERERMAARARAVGEDFDPVKVASKFADLYLWLAGEGPAPSTLSIA